MQFDPNKEGCVIVLTGRPKSGKTPIIKELISNAGFDNNVIYDPRGEYSEDYTLFRNFKIFKEVIFNLTDCFIVVEEATPFIKSFRNEDIEEKIIGIEHNHNVIIFVFHSLLDTPAWILRKCQFFILLPCNDDPKDVKRSRNKYYPYFLKARETNKAIWIDINKS